jgi:hypothetical protein
MASIENSFCSHAVCRLLLVSIRVQEKGSFDSETKRTGNLGAIGIGGGATEGRKRKCIDYVLPSWELLLSHLIWMVRYRCDEVRAWRLKERNGVYYFHLVEQC